MVKFLKHSVKPLDKTQIQPMNANFHLKVVQQPVKARVAGRKQTRNSSRRLIDPQPVIEIRLAEGNLNSNNNNHDINIIDHSLSIFFVRASIECLGSNDRESFFQKQRKSRFFEKTEDDGDVLRGTTTVSAQFYRGSPYIACAVFDNLSVRYKGNYRLKFDLYETQPFSVGSTIIPKIIHWEKSTRYSSVFTVYTDAAFDGLEASPELNNELKKAGCKIRARKHRNGNGLAHLDGFKINKKFTYNNGQFKYAFSGNNHFGLDQDLLNRPGTSVDFAMLQNFQKAQVAATSAANMSRASNNNTSAGHSINMNYSNNNNSGFGAFPEGNPATITPIKRPQTALPQLITFGEQFDFNNSYKDMLRSAVTSGNDYSLAPLEAPRPKRVINNLSSQNSAGTSNAPISTPNLLYADVFDSFKDYNSNSKKRNTTASPSTLPPPSALPKHSLNEGFLSPVVYPSVNSGATLLEANGINNKNAFFGSNITPFNDQYALNGASKTNIAVSNNINNVNNAVSSMMAMMMNNNGAAPSMLGGANADIPGFEDFPISLLGDAGANNAATDNSANDGNNGGNAANRARSNSSEVPRSTLPLEPIPIFWEFGNANTTSVNELSGIDDAENVNQRQQQQFPGSQAQIQQQQQHYSQNQSQQQAMTQHPDLLVDNEGVLSQNQQSIDAQQQGQQFADLQAGLLNFNDIYQQSEMLLRGNFLI